MYALLRRCAPSVCSSFAARSTLAVSTPVALRRALQTSSPSLSSSAAGAGATAATMGKSTAVRVGSLMYDGVRTQALSKEFFDVLGVSRAFEQRAQLVITHMWMALVRLRSEGENGSMIAQVLADHLWDDMWRMMLTDGVHELAVGKNMRGLEKVYYASLVALDEGLVRDDMALAGALYRNLFQISNCAASVAAAVHYIRHTLKVQHDHPSEEVLAGKLPWLPAPTSLELPASLS